MDIDQELLIRLVNDRPALWDKTTEEYKNKRLTFDAWKEVFKSINPNFKELSNEEKNEFGKLIMKKWSNMRDSFIKHHKKVNEYKFGSKAKKRRKYLFSDQMQFLIKIINNHPTQLNTMDPFEGEEKETPAENYSKNKLEPPKKKKKEELNEVDKKFLKFLDTSINEDKSRVMHFFRGIASTVESFSDEDFLDFQLETLKVVKRIKQKSIPQSLVYPFAQWKQEPYCGYRTAPITTSFDQLHGCQSAGPSGLGVKSEQETHGIGQIGRNSRPISSNSDAVDSPSVESVYSTLDELDFTANSLH